jgi:hypothetical protein
VEKMKFSLPHDPKEVRLIQEAHEILKQAAAEGADIKATPQLIAAIALKPMRTPTNLTPSSELVASMTERRSLPVIKVRPPRPAKRPDSDPYGPLRAAIVRLLAIK